MTDQDPTEISPPPPPPPSPPPAPSPPPPPPPPPVPETAVGTGPVSADSGSRRRLLIGGGILAAIVVVVAAVLIFGGGDDDGGSGDRIAIDEPTDDAGTDVGDSPLDGSEIPDDLRDQLAEAYHTSLGLPEEKADCLAGKIADAVEAGELDQEQAMQEMFGYLADCDIDMSELTGAGSP